MDDMAAAYYHPPPVAAHYPYYPPPQTHAPPLTGTPQTPYHHYLPAPVPPSRTHLSPQHYGTPADHPSRDEVRTLFIAGLPDDVKPREIYNLFREFPGYQSAQLRRSGQSSQAYAFTVFTDQQSALSAMRALNGLMFDLERESTLYIDLAKSNSRFKRSRTDDGVSYSYDKRVRGSVAYSRGFSDSAGAGSHIHMPGMVNSAYSLNDFPSAQSQTNFGYEAKHKMLNNSTYTPQSNPPCPTLFVANLGPKSSEQELAQVFSRCPGFLKLKMQNKNGVPVAFVDFQDTSSSTGARNHLQGTILYSSVGEGMRLEYAKSRMGLRKREKKT
ncbi:RNA-binding protein L isoform X1 [Musa acuminata AAA Group]|uniref:RNA-binding protein L isoform X1 n=1 Tax=Musa acuminata AAA Group TaxID=214697 RepID=UPI0031D9CBDE